MIFRERWLQGLETDMLTTYIHIHHCHWEWPPLISFMSLFNLNPAACILVDVRMRSHRSACIFDCPSELPQFPILKGYIIPSLDFFSLIYLMQLRERERGWNLPEEKLKTYCASWTYSLNKTRNLHGFLYSINCSPRSLACACISWETRQRVIPATASQYRPSRVGRSINQASLF